MSDEGRSRQDTGRSTTDEKQDLRATDRWLHCPNLVDKWVGHSAYSQRFVFPFIGSVFLDTTSSLIGELSSLCKQDDEEKGEICLPKQQQIPRKGSMPLIQEMSPDAPKKKNTSSDLFAKNLQKAFNEKKPNSKSEQAKNNGEIKIRNDETFLKEVTTRRIKTSM